MNQKSLNIVYGIIIVALLVIGVYLVVSKKPSTETSVTNTPTETAPTTPATPTPPTDGDQNSSYETQYMKVTLLPGWTAKQAAGGNPEGASVNITKGNYILYINTQATQASGVEGGRFGEIAKGAPSADAVVTEQPSPQCGTQDTTTAFLDFKRADLYVASGGKKDYCAVPTNGKTVWYFSYLTTSSGGYFNYYKAGEPPALVVTMAYDSKVVNDLPVKGSTELQNALSDMTAIVKSLQIK